MARPRLNPEDKRNIDFKIKLTKDEKTILTREAELSGLEEAPWARLKMFGSLPDRRKPNPYRESIIRGLAEMGNIRSHLARLNAPREALLNRLETLADQLIKELSDGHTR